MKRQEIFVVILGLLLAGAGCGFETFLATATGDDHPAPDGGIQPDPEPAIIEGSIPASAIAGLDALDMHFFSGAGVEQSPKLSVAGETFEAAFEAGLRLVGLTVRAERGTVAYRALVPVAEPGQTTSAGDFDGIDNRETAACLLVQAKASSSGRGLTSYPADSLQTALDELQALSSSGPVQTFYNMVQAVTACSDCARGTALRFRDPHISSNGQVLQSPLHPDFIFANPIDYDGDATAEDTTLDFDVALLAALEAFEFKACFCDEDDYFAACCADTAAFAPSSDPAEIALACGQDGRKIIRSFFAVDFNDGLKDGSCLAIDRFRWTDPQAGASMFFVGGIIESDSPIWDPDIDAKLGAWAPNTIPMYDDGSHGDESAGDGVWTISFVLPSGLRMGYKYTWGLAGQQWGGTEEWPGNRRLLEIEDVNGDHVVARYDHYGDEATNKDNDNTLPPSMGGTGLVTWDTQNADGDFITRERPRDTDNDCTLDSWWTPSNLPALTTTCP